MPGCPAGGGGSASDTWAEVTDLRQIIGTWESPVFPVIMPEISLAPFLEMMGDDVSYLPESLPKAPLDVSLKITVTDFDIKEEVIVNCKRYLKEVLKKTMPGSESLIWGMLSPHLAQYLAEDKIMGIIPFPDGITSFGITDVTNDYEILAEGSGPMPEDTSIPDDEGFSLYINRSQQKLKLIIEASDDTEIPEIILNKKK
jgi:hypothetical protein